MKELPQAADGLIFNILSDPEIVYLPKNVKVGDVWLEKGRDFTNLTCSDI